MPPKGSKAKKAPRTGKLGQIAENGEKQKEHVVDEEAIDVPAKKASRTTRRGVFAEDTVNGGNVNGKIKEPEEITAAAIKKSKRGVKAKEIEIPSEEIASSLVEPEKVTKKKAADLKKAKSDEVVSENQATTETEKVPGKRGRKKAVETVSSNQDQAENTNGEEDAEAGPSKLARRTRRDVAAASRDPVEIEDEDDIVIIPEEDSGAARKTRGGRNGKATAKEVAPAARGRKRKAVGEKAEDKETKKACNTENIHCTVDIERNSELDELARNSSKVEAGTKVDPKKKGKDLPKIEEVTDDPKEEEVKDDPKKVKVTNDLKEEEVEDDTNKEEGSKIEEDKKPAKSVQKRGRKNGGNAKPAKAQKQEPGSSISPDTSSNFDNSSKTKDGEPWNYKIVSWNINGIRAWLEKDGLNYLHLEQPDVMCVQETKCSASKLPSELKEIEGYHCHWLAAQKEGYSGVGMLFKKEPISIKDGIGMEEHDDEGRVITAEYEDFYIVTSYTPNAARGLTRLGYRIQWDHAFRDYIKRLDEVKPVILCGDLNVAHEEIDLTNPKSNKKNAGFTPEEREGFSDLLKEGFVDTFRHLYPEETGAYTFWTYMMNARAKNVGWRLDYFVISERFTKQHLCDSAIRKNVMGSDHCPIVLFLHV